MVRPSTDLVLKMLFPEKDDLSKLKSVTFLLLFAMCDFFAFGLKMEAL